MSHYLTLVSVLCCYDECHSFLIFILGAIMLNVVVLSVAIFNSCSECHYAECCYAKCRGTDDDTFSIEKI
jgi:hypothetical protein